MAIAQQQANEQDEEQEAIQKAVSIVVADGKPGHVYVALRNCPFSFHVDPETGAPSKRGVSHYSKGEVIKSTIDPLVIPHHFECTDPEVQKIRDEAHKEYVAERKRANAAHALEAVEQSAPMQAAAAIVEQLRKAQGQALPVADEGVVTRLLNRIEALEANAGVTAPVETPEVTEPETETSDDAAEKDDSGEPNYSFVSDEG